MNLRIQNYHAQIKNGDMVVDVEDNQPEIFVAKVLEAVDSLPNSGSTPTELRVDAIPSPKENIVAIVSSVQAAIEKFVDAAKSNLELRDVFLKRFGTNLGQAAIDSWERQAALNPKEEAERLGALSGVNTVTILEGTSVNWGQELQDRLRDIGVLSVGKATPPLALQVLKNRFGSTMLDTDFEELTRNYDALPDLSGVVEDANIRRLCSALTTSGFKTRYSCEGHGYELAHVKFVCSTEQKDELQTLLNNSTGILNEEWMLIEDHMDDKMLRYRLQPKNQDSRSTRHNRVIADLDVIGMLVLQKFAQEVDSAKSLEDRR